MNLVVRDAPLREETVSGEFRNAMRHLAGGVSVITAGRGDDISGMTVTSVASLAVDPPTLTVAINRKASTLPLIRRYGAFGVNILAGDQVDVAERFTGKDGHKGAERFAGRSWTVGPFGVPLLKGCADCHRLRGGRNHRAALTCDCAGSRCSSGAIGGECSTRLLAR